VPLELPEEFDPEEFKRWTPAAQERALEMLQNIKNAPRIWYCMRGRSCDGKPHEGVEYPHARSDQWPPVGSWRYWLCLSGRGSGKTRLGAEWIRKMSNHAGAIAMVGRTGPDVRNTMVEGDSGLIRVCEAANVGYTWEPSRSLFTFANGCQVFGFSAEKPDRLRGPQYSLGWLDEPAHMASIQEVWDNLMFGLRIKIPGGTKVLVTSTPKPIPWLKKMSEHKRAVIARVSTYANIDNLDEDFREELLETYEGTRIGRQELHGEILGDIEGALWTWDLLEKCRHQVDGTIEQFAATMDRIVVAIDPAGTSRRKSDETGIIVMGKKDGIIYVLADASGKYTPQRWAQRAVDLYDHWHADAIVVENNYGGEMVKSTLTNISAYPRIKEVNSTRGKLIRAEPVFSLYEQIKVKHVGSLTDFEGQLTEWVPGQGDSPDRMDAMVHGAHELMDNARPAEIQTASGLIIPKTASYNRSRSRQVASITAPARLTRPTVRSWS
jgi:phage terminase large subunit-like protein